MERRRQDVFDPALTPSGSGCRPAVRFLISRSGSGGRRAKNTSACQVEGLRLSVLEVLGRLTTVARSSSSGIWKHLGGSGPLAPQQPLQALLVVLALLGLVPSGGSD